MVLAIRAAGRLATRFLTAYVRVVDATERALRRVWSSLGRAIARISRPFAALLRRIARRLDAIRWWLTARVFAPIGRWLSAAGRAMARWGARWAAPS